MSLSGTASAARDRWKHRNLVTVGNLVGPLSGVAVSPYVAGCEEFAKVVAVRGDSGIEDLADGGPGHLSHAGSGHLAGRCKETKRHVSHDSFLSASRSVAAVEHLCYDICATGDISTGGHPHPHQKASVPCAQMLNLLLARHGQSEWNAAGRWQGQADPPLSDLGLSQAQAAAQQAGTFDAIFASDLVRALHTATIISTAIGIGPVIIDPRLKERDAGEYSGLTRDEIEAQFPGALAEGRWPAGWEPDNVLLTRVSAALDAILDHAGGVGDILAVAHGGVIYTLESHHGQPHERIGNLGGRWFHHDGSAWHLGERIELAPESVTIDHEDMV